MHNIVVFLAVVGVTYGIYALSTFTVSYGGMREQVERDSADIKAKSQGSGVKALAFIIGRPLYWFVTLPLKSVGAALFLSILLVLPVCIF